MVDSQVMLMKMRRVIRELEDISVQYEKDVVDDVVRKYDVFIHRINERSGE